MSRMLVDPRARRISLPPEAVGHHRQDESPPPHNGGAPSISRATPPLLRTPFLDPPPPSLLPIRNMSSAASSSGSSRAFDFRPLPALAAASVADSFYQASPGHIIMATAAHQQQQSPVAEAVVMPPHRATIRPSDRSKSSEDWEHAWGAHHCLSAVSDSRRSSCSTLVSSSRHCSRKPCCANLSHLLALRIVYCCVMCPCP